MHCSSCGSPAGSGPDFGRASLDGKIDSITPDKSANLILTPRHALNLAPMADPVAALMLGGHAGNVEAAIAKWRPVKWSSRLLDCDPCFAIRLLEPSREYLYAKRANTTAPPRDPSCLSPPFASLESENGTSQSG